MSLLNYSTTVKAEKTAGEVMKILVANGARQIMSDYDEEGEISSISFSVWTSNGLRGFTLPVNHKPVEKILRDDPKVPNAKKNEHHARNVAWRIMKDWVEAQMALVQTSMVTFEQVMLPYMRSIDGQTFYEVYLQGLGTQPAIGGNS